MKVNFNGTNQNLRVNFTGSPIIKKSSSDAEMKTNNSLQIPDNYGRYVAFKGDSKIENRGDKSSISIRLEKLRSEMKKEDLDALLVMSTDEYLDETVDKNQSQRIYISGFDGSNGDVVVTPDNAKLIVDGRYHLQADNQVDHDCYKVEKLGLDVNGNPVKGDGYLSRMIKVLTKLSSNNPDKTLKIGYDPNMISAIDLKDIQEGLKANVANVELIATEDNLVDKVRNGKPSGKALPVRELPLELTGESSVDKLQRLRNKLSKDNIDATVITNLNDIAYLTNLRGKDIDYSTLFKSKAFMTQDKAYVFCDPAKIPSSVKESLNGVIEFKPENEFINTIKETVSSSNNPLKIAYMPDSTNQFTYNALQKITGVKGELVELKDNPIGEMRSIKNEKEMATMQNGIIRTDKAVANVINWVNESVKNNITITEKDLEDKMREAHFKQGANDLSFEIIPASGANGAIIHYSKADPNKKINKGELVLLDTGAYYDAGYATDLTRTWLAGGKDAEATKEQKKIYTTVLKGALKGLNADLPSGAKGKDLDDIVRGTIKEKGYDYLHGTGHGVGISVHENPPTISNAKSGDKEIKEGQVFSIEPGIYIPDWGGVRFENLATIVKHPDPEKAKQGWHKVKCLSHAPVDHNLIDKKLLDQDELKWIREFDEKTNQELKNS